jgi:hypothetical protein
LVVGLVALGMYPLYGFLNLHWYAAVAVLGGAILILYRYEEQAAHWSWLLMGLIAAGGLRLAGLGILWGQGTLHPDAYWRADLPGRAPAPQLLTTATDGSLVYHDAMAGCSVHMPKGWTTYTRDQLFRMSGSMMMASRHREWEAPKFACAPDDPRLILVLGESQWNGRGKLAEGVGDAREANASALEMDRDERDEAVVPKELGEEDFTTPTGVSGHLDIFATPDGRRHFLYLLRDIDGPVLVLEGVDLDEAGDAKRVFDAIAHGVTPDPRPPRPKFPGFPFTLPSGTPGASGAGGGGGGGGGGGDTDDP